MTVLVTKPLLNVCLVTDLFRMCLKLNHVTYLAGNVIPPQRGFDPRCDPAVLRLSQCEVCPCISILSRGQATNMVLGEQKLLSPIIHMAQMAWEEMGYRYKLHSAQTRCLHLNSYRETGLFFKLFSKAPSGMRCKQLHKNYYEREQGTGVGLNSSTQNHGMNDSLGILP